MVPVGLAGLATTTPCNGLRLCSAISAFGVSAQRVSDDSLDFAKRMLNEAGVAATPGIDFDPVDGRHFLRFCYAGSADEMREAVERIGKWLKT
jgi:aspartate/methionine/tyrosine aminotransferase